MQNTNEEKKKYFSTCAAKEICVLVLNVTSASQVYQQQTENGF